MVQNYICGMVHSSCQILNGTFAKFIHSEDIVVDVGDTVDIVLKHVNAEGLMEVCVEIEKTHCECYSGNMRAKRHKFALSTNKKLQLSPV